MTFLKSKSVLEITSGLKSEENVKIKMSIVDTQKDLTFLKTHDCKCLFHYKDNDLVLKTICAIISQFNASINVTTDRMDGGDIYECANLLMIYTHDRIEDLILCLRMAKEGKFGKIYNRVDTLVLMEFWNKYLDMKSHFFEEEYKREKNSRGNYRDEIDTMIIREERKFESEKDKLQRIANAAKAEIRSLKEVIKNQDL